jgi:S-adenosylmethionine decarboxylase
MTTEGQQLILDLWLQPIDVEYLADSICEYIYANFTVVGRAEHKFNPQGRTIVLILSESHLTIHTYPEQDYLSMDLYICKMTTDLQKVAQEIVDMTSVKHAQYKIFKRGHRG